MQLRNWVNELVVSWYGNIVISFGVDYELRWSNLFGFLWDKYCVSLIKG